MPGRPTRPVPVVFPTPLVLFHVRIHYREPTYELHNGPRAEPYRISYDLYARDAEHARRLALNEFNAGARDSWVGWVREVVGVEVAVVSSCA